jgi:hypothetical protein
MQMQSVRASFHLNGVTFTSKHRLAPRRLAAGIAAAAAMLCAATARAVIIMPTSAANIPVSAPASIFDASHAGNTYTLAPATHFITSQYDVRDLFGGSFGNGAEPNDVLFQDNQPIGTIDTVDVALAAPVSLTTFNLFLEDDGSNGDRSASAFELFANGQMIDDVPILDNTGTQSYTSVYGSNYIEISDSFSSLPASANYTLELVQNQNAYGSSGVRALEFEATANAPSAVPEPAAISGSLVGAMVMSRRRRRAAF